VREVVALAAKADDGTTFAQWAAHNVTAFRPAS